ncbi:MAG: hypothetical protein ACRCYS_05970 [Beijerinckiaceae bacterium]
MSQQVLSDLDFVNVSRILNLPAPASGSEPATKTYVDSAIEGLAWKDNTRVATQANVSIASPGASIDSISMGLNDRVLVRAQTTAAENGIYIWNGAAVPMTRSFDASTADELEQAIVTVDEGTSAGSTYRQTLVNFTLGSGAINWGNFGTSAGAATETSAGIAELATQAETDAGTADNVIVTPLKLATWSSRARRFEQTFGDGSATQFTITHNFNTRDVQIEVYRTSGNFDTVMCDRDRPSVNQARLTFSSAPASNAFRVVIHA